MANNISLKNQQVIVTGGTGFIGSHLCEELLAQGANVVAIDNLITGNKQNVAHLSSNFTFIEADVTQPVASFFPTDRQPDLVLHFASPASPPKYQAHPVETYLVNSAATHNLLQYLHQHAPKVRFLFASTSEIYGDPLEHPQKESYWGNVNPNGIRSCYDEAKRLGETICGVHAREFHMDVRIVRIFNTYGPRMDIHDGRVVTNLLDQAMHHQPLTIYGDGTQTRSYCYVKDLVDGILRFAQCDGLAGETVNLGNPEEYTVLETAQLIQRLCNDHSECVHSPLPKDDPTRRRPDISKAQRLLNWSPKISFEEGLLKTIEYFQQHA